MEEGLEEELPSAEELQLLQETLTSYGAPLATAAASPARSWLAGRLDTAEGTAEVLERLQAAVDAPGFLATLSEKPAGAPVPPPCDVTRRSFWFWKRADSAAVAERLLSLPAPPTSTPAEPLDCWTVVDQGDVVDALAHFIARFVAAHPHASELSPEQLQRALSTALKDVRRSKLRSLWEWGRSIHRWGVWSYGVVSMYENPWLVRAFVCGLWTAGRCAVGLVF